MDLQKYVLSEEVIQKYLPLSICKKLYSLKIYGVDNIDNSVGKLVQNIQKRVIWNLNEAIDILWAKYKSKIKLREINCLSDLRAISDSFKIVFSSIPLDVFFHLSDNSESLEAKTAYVTLFKSEVNLSQKVYYDVDPSSIVYRMGNMFGTFFIESTEPLSFGSPILIKKVEPSNISYGDLFPDNITLIGRYGSWNKEVLAHHAYYEAIKKL